MIHLGCRGVVREDSTLWFSNNNFNGLFTMDLDTGCVEFVHQFEECPIENEFTHADVFKEEDELIFIPWAGKQIVVYNLVTKLEYNIVLPIEGNYYGKAYRINNVLWLFPGYSKDKAFCFNIKEKTLVVNEEISEAIFNVVDGENVCLQYHKYANYITIFYVRKNIICNINLNSLVYQFVKVDNSEIDIIGGMYDGEDYWFMAKENANIYQWNPKCNKWTEYVSEDDSVVDCWKNIFYKEMTFINGEIILTSFYAANIKRVNRAKKILEKLSDYPMGFKIIKEKSSGATFESTLLYGDEICFIPNRGNQIVCYNLKTNKVRGIELAVATEKIPYLSELVKIRWKETILEKEEFNTLSFYLKYIPFYEANEKKGENGFKIFNKLSEE